MKLKNLLLSALVLVAVNGNSTERRVELFRLDDQTFEFSSFSLVSFKSHGYEVVLKVYPKESSAALQCIIGNPQSVSGDNIVMEIPETINFSNHDYIVERIDSPLSDLKEILFTFTYGTDLKNLTLGIPATVESIDPEQFAYLRCRGYEVDPANSHYTSLKGVLYSHDLEKLVSYPANLSLNSASGTPAFELPQSVKEILPYAFTATKNRIILNNNIKSIPGNAFSYSSQNAVLPETIETVGVSAFSFAPANYLPAGVKRIEKFCLSYGCYSDYGYDEMTYWNDDQNLLLRNELLLPASLEYLGEGALYNTPARLKDNPLCYSNIKDIYFMSPVPPETMKKAMPQEGAVIADEARVDVNVYVPAEAVKAYQALVDNGVWSSVNKIQAHPDRIYPLDIVCFDGWENGVRKMEARFYELGGSKVEDIDWRVNDSSIAIINDSGLLTALKPGIVTVNCRLTDNIGNIYDLSPISLRISAEDVSAIDDIYPDSDTGKMKGVYNLHGIKVGESIESIPAGIYIINGRKVAVQ